MKNLTSSSLLLAGAVVATTGVASAQGYQARMGEPLQGLTQAELDLFELGRTAFNTILTVEQGLGPIFNDSSCGQCHSNPAVGGFSTETVTRFGVLGPVFDPLDGTGPSGLDLGGSLGHKQAIDPAVAEVVPDSSMTGGLPVHTAQRSTGHAFGIGLLQRIDDSVILDLVSNPPAPGISGFARMVTPVGQVTPVVGKLGWKAHTPDSLSFAAGGAKNELGLTNRFETQENAPNGNAALLAIWDTAPAGNPTAPDDSAALANSILGTNDTLEMIDYIAAFQELLAPPPQTPRSGMTGEVVFNNIGCADCHVPELPTLPDANPVFDQVSVRSYSDFLLHDMGAANGDGIDEGNGGDGQSFRSTPLWGMSQKEGYRHGGQATGGNFEQNVDAALQAHGGEGANARAAYNALSATDKDHLFNFLSSLGRPEFDIEGSLNGQNSKIGGFDWFFIRNSAEGDLFTGPGDFFTPDDLGAICDVDQDGDFDMQDYGVFMRAFTGD